MGAQPYPAMLVTTSFYDSQVQYHEPAKWVARLRAAKPGPRPLLFRVSMAGGHEGMAGRLQGLEEIALEYAFILDCLGLRR